ncbi:MAG: hypothetical protein Q8N44_02870 [Rubrivivax sp.]|nr:hypothetical protein [Rubrivivax sp.]
MTSAQIKYSAATIRDGITFDLLVFLSGCWLNNVAYESLQPTLAAVIFWTIGATPLWLLGSNLRPERSIFTRLFAIGWFAAGIAAIYAEVLQDPLQLGSDAGSFFDLARGEAGGLSIEDIRVFTEGAGAILLWRAVYDGFAAIGFDRARYVGILINVCAIALTGVLGVRMIRIIYGHDIERINRLTTMFSFCGLLWLFASIHLRDAVVLLVVTGNCLIWVRYLAAPKANAIPWLIVTNLVFFSGLALLRTEFAFVPIAMLLGAVGSFALSTGLGTRRRLLFVLAGAAILSLAAATYTDLSDDALFALSRGSETYSAQANEQAATGSMGLTLIVNQPLAVRLPLGLAYLFVFPIPFWSGFQLETAASLFKSFNALFFYALTPLAGLAVVRIWQQRALRNRVNVFLVLVTFGFALAIAGTSLETRHFGAFISPLFMLALLPDLRQDTERRAYRSLLVCLLGLLAAVHVAWILLKLAA